MSIPLWLMDAVEERSSQHSPKKLALAYSILNKTYKDNRATSVASSENDLFWDAYLAARFPATYGAVERALDEIPQSILAKIQTVLDIGTGTGAAVFAMAEALSQKITFTCLDQEARPQEILDFLWQKSPYEDNFAFNWMNCDIQKGLPQSLETYDAVVCSYTLGETNSIQKILQDGWNKTRHIFILIEPGTMPGFSIIKKAREFLCSQGAFIAAPCPHNGPCPMEHGNWCHFSARIPRSSCMRKIKGGELGYEDEKFSYCVFVRESIDFPSARILRHPQIHGGHVSFQLCTKQGIQDCLVSKKNSQYKKARKSSWGNSWDMP